MIIANRHLIAAVFIIGGCSIEPPAPIAPSEPTEAKRGAPPESESQIAPDVDIEEANRSRAVVTPTMAHFWFLVENAHGAWAWGVSARDMCEYSWMVKVPADTAQYQLGYMMFNGQPGKQTGSFSDLVASGQTDLWHYDPKKQSATIIRDVRHLRARVKVGGLLLELTDKEWIKRLFDAKPKSLEFAIGGTQQVRKVSTVGVQYVEAGQNGNDAK